MEFQAVAPGTGGVNQNCRVSSIASSYSAAVVHL